MALNKITLGKYVKIYNKKCSISNLTPEQVSGINKDKEFFEPSHQVASDTKNYKEVPPGYFACNLMHVGRDKVLPIAYNHTNDIKNVSPAYIVFKITDESMILNEYFFMFLKSEETDRYFWFHTDSSVRDGMSWEDFCNLELEVPNIDIQQKYVNIYNSMLNNQNIYEQGLNDLKVICDSYLDKLIKEKQLDKLSNYIEEISKKNDNDKYSNKDIRGISIAKEFIKTKADTNNVSTRNYKLVEPNCFAFNPNTARMGEKICITLNRTNKVYLVSSIYPVFKIVDTKKINPEYLMLFYSRSEFDRYARFNSWGSAREMFSMEDMKNVYVPVPKISIQNSIVGIYKAYLKRKKIYEVLKNNITTICPILIKGSIME